jgi:Ran GTPase-activating protein (RanGAP) involved in mRNA processing and transport
LFLPLPPFLLLLFSFSFFSCTTTQLCDSLRLNTSIKNLNLSNNHFGETGAEKLRNALLNNRTIKVLDLSRNALGFRSINALLCSCKSNGMYVQTNGNFVFEEILNSLSHGLAFLASVVGANLLIAQVSNNTLYIIHHTSHIIHHTHLCLSTY